MGELNVLIVDDYTLMREGLKSALGDLADIRVVSEAISLPEMFTKLEYLQPHILILEINLCEHSIKDILQHVKQLAPQCKVLVFSDCFCELPVILSIRAGIAGFIRKNISKSDLTHAIRSIAIGVHYFSPEITQILAKGFLSNNTLSANLSEREMEILNYICKGRSNEQIADILFISEKTVGTHRKNIMKKVGVKKSSDLIVWAMENNLVKK
jgi:DNA-binding NarL/FixJ family response regulator